VGITQTESQISVTVSAKDLIKSKIYSEAAESFSSPFGVVVDRGPGKFRKELVDTQRNSDLKDKCNDLFDIT
jgi:hypothetical protein